MLFFSAPSRAGALGGLVRMSAAALEPPCLGGSWVLICGITSRVATAKAFLLTKRTLKLGSYTLYYYNYYSSYEGI